MIRKLSLAEWFLSYQLEFIEKHYCHISGVWEIDLTKLVDRFDGDIKTVPFTSVLIKACALWQRECPEINRQVFKTPLGKRFYSCDQRAVNVPALLQYNGRPYLSVVSIKQADQKPLAAIQQALKDYTKTDPKALPVGRFVINKRNHFFNRLRLIIIHTLVNRFPGLAEKFQVGTISVSSLLSSQQDADVTFMAKGPGAMSLTLCHVDDATNTMKIGFSWDHATANGYEAVAASKMFCMILQGEKPELFNELVG